MWISIWSGTNEHHCYLYDLDRTTILGEIVNGGPGFMSHDQSSVLCVWRIPSNRAAGSSWRLQLSALVRNLTRGKISFDDNDLETVWAVSLQRGGATRLGSLAQSRGAGSEFVPSPSFRYGYNKPTGSFQTSDLFICDLQRRSLFKRWVPGWPSGWWSDSQITVKDPGNNFYLYDVVTEQKTPLLSVATVMEALRKAAIDASPAETGLFLVWNGHENEYYLADLHRRWLATNSFLFKVERPSLALKLVTKDFKFEWSDHFDPTGTWYVYSGREAGDRSSGVFLRNLRNNSDLTLVPPDGGKSFSLPNFYHDTVIYSRSNKLWQVELTGSNHTQLFPPPDSRTTTH